MRRCSSECYPVCDFCEHYAFNGLPVNGLDGIVAVVYVGAGECQHPDHPRPEEPESYCEDFYCLELAKEDERQLRWLSDLNVLTTELAILWDAGDPLMHSDVPPEMRTNHAYSGAGFADENPQNTRNDAHGSLRHSRAHTRAQRERYIAKRLGYYPWHAAPAGLLAKWSGGSNVRQRRAERSWAGKNDRNLKRPKYPLDPEAA